VVKADDYTEGIDVAYTRAHDAIDDEKLAKVREVVWRMRAGRARIAEQRKAVDMLEFLLRYIDRVDAKWRGIIEEEVKEQVRKAKEADRVRKMAKQKRDNELRRERQGAEGRMAKGIGA